MTNTQVIRFKINKKPIFANQNRLKMIEFSRKCFVCETEIINEDYSMNQEINLPVCNTCKGTTEEQKAVKDLTEGLADGFVCGCI